MTIIADWRTAESSYEARDYQDIYVADEVDDWGYEATEDGYTTPVEIYDPYDPHLDDTLWEDTEYGPGYEALEGAVEDTYDPDWGLGEEAGFSEEVLREGATTVTEKKEEKEEKAWWDKLLGNKDLMQLLLAGGMSALSAFGSAKKATPVTRSTGGGGGRATSTALAGESGIVTRG